MRYRCDTCGTEQWRGLFPESHHNWRYPVFHGAAIGIYGIATKELFAWLGIPIDGWRTRIANLFAAALLMFVFYGIAITTEAACVSGRRCRKCGEHGLHPI